MSGPNRRVLCVDDEPNVLEGLERCLGFDFDILTAPSGAEGLATLNTSEPVAVVISDMRMPGMDGASFLAEAKIRWPDTVRVLLTGHAEFEAAMRAVNQGQIYRFLTKPCPAPQLVEVIESAVEQHRLIRAERELLEETLHGSVKVLTEVLSLVRPLTFSRGSRLRGYVASIVDGLGLSERWQFDLAAMLSQVGCITMPDAILERFHSGQALSPEQKEAFNAHPAAGEALVAKIPRLDAVAKMIGAQLTPYQALRSAELSKEEGMGAAMLKVGLDFDHIVVAERAPASRAFEIMRQRDGWYWHEALNALEKAEQSRSARRTADMTAAELRPGMVLDQDVTNKNGLLLVARGQDISFAVLRRLRVMAEQGQLAEPFRVQL